MQGCFAHANDEKRQKSFRMSQIERVQISRTIQKQIFNEENQFTAYYKEITKLQSVV